MRLPTRYIVQSSLPKGDSSFKLRGMNNDGADSHEKTSAPGQRYSSPEANIALGLHKNTSMLTAGHATVVHEISEIPYAVFLRSPYACGDRKCVCARPSPAAVTAFSDFSDSGPSA
jgi:hypothetical protein